MDANLLPLFVGYTFPAHIGSVRVLKQTLVTNPAFELHSGLKDAVGKTVRELVPDQDAHWFEVYGRIALTGIPARFESPAKALGRFFDVYAFRVDAPDEHHVAVLFKDITERTRSEATLRAFNEQLEQRVNERTEALRHLHEQLRELSVHMERMREDERTRIAREMHDDLGGELVALKISLDSLSWGHESDSALVAHIDDLKAHIDNIIHIVRRIGSDLRPPVLDDYGLLPALEWHASEWERRTGILCRLDLLEYKPKLKHEQRTAMFRVFQEALTYVAKHAQATQIVVTLGVDEDELVLVIEDDGVGINTDQLNSEQSLRLKGMQERMKEVGGVVDIEGQASQGTTLAIRLPIIGA